MWTNTRYRMIYMNMGHNDIDYENKTNKELSSTFAEPLQNQLIAQALAWLWQPHAIVDVARPLAAVARMPRLTAVDALRGAIMIVMALDHTRDFLHIGAMSFSPEDLSRTTAALFFTRWITHICAPVFMFTAGLGAFFRLQRPGTIKADLSRFLWTRGVWLVIVELTIMRLAMNFSLDARFPVILPVLSALGLSMICLAVLVHLPRHVLAIGSLAVVALHNLLDGVQASTFGALAPVWNLLHQQGFFVLGGIPFVVAYPLVPWVAVMALGFWRWQPLPPPARRAGSACSCAGELASSLPSS